MDWKANTTHHFTVKTTDTHGQAHSFSTKVNIDVNNVSGNLGIEGLPNAIQDSDNVLEISKRSLNPANPELVEKFNGSANSVFCEDGKEINAGEFLGHLKGKSWTADAEKLLAQVGALQSSDILVAAKDNTENEFRSHFKEFSNGAECSYTTAKRISEDLGGELENKSEDLLRDILARSHHISSDSYSMRGAVDASGLGVSFHAVDQWSSPTVTSKHVVEHHKDTGLSGRMFSTRMLHGTEREEDQVTTFSSELQGVLVNKEDGVLGAARNGLSDEVSFDAADKSVEAVCKENPLTQITVTTETMGFDKSLSVEAKHEQAETTYKTVGSSAVVDVCKENPLTQITVTTETMGFDESLSVEAKYEQAETTYKTVGSSAVVDMCMNARKEHEWDQRLKLPVATFSTVLESENQQAYISCASIESSVGTRTMTIDHDEAAFSSSDFETENAQDYLSKSKCRMYTKLGIEGIQQNGGPSSSQHGQAHLAGIPETTASTRTPTLEHSEAPVVTAQEYQPVSSVTNQSKEFLNTVVKFEECSTKEIEIKQVDCTMISEENSSEVLSHMHDEPTGELPSHEHDHAGEYVRKSFTCDTNGEDEDEQLREHWTRTLQSSTSTGEIVEEIVKVLKHQKTHDLLCPVCGSCITKRVVLRKRKRTSMISVDRWYPDRLEEDEEISVQDATIEALQIEDEEEDTQESSLLPGSDDQDKGTEAYGCLACFSLFFKKGQSLSEPTQDEDVERETFRCLPFFFPPYRWGMSWSKQSIPELRGEHASQLNETEILHVQEDKTSLLMSEHQAAVFHGERDLTCGLGSAVLPDYPWGMSSRSEEVNGIVPPSSASQEPIQNLPPEPVVSKPLDLIVEEKQEFEQSTIKCLEFGFDSGLHSTMLPKYPWGQNSIPEGNGILSPSLASQEAKQNAPPKPLVSEPLDLIVGEKQEFEESTIKCSEFGLSSGLRPAMLPEYPWGQTSIPEVNGILPPSSASQEAKQNVAPKPLVSEPLDLIVGEKQEFEESTIKCLEFGFSSGLHPAILPEYPWGQNSIPEVNGIFPPSSASQKPKQNVPPKPIVSEPLDLVGGEKQELEESTIKCLEFGFTSGLRPTMVLEYPCGQTSIPDGVKDQQETQETKEKCEFVGQETKLEAHITTTTSIITVTAVKADDLVERPHKDIGSVSVDKPPHTHTESIRLDQTVSTLNASVQFNKPSTVQKTPTNSLVTLPSTGFALLDLPEGETLTSRPSTGFAFLKELDTRPQSSPGEEQDVQEDPTQEKGSESSPEEVQINNMEAEPIKPSTRWQFPWFNGKVSSSDDLTKPLLESTGTSKAGTWVSVSKSSKPSDDLTEPRLESGSVLKIPKPSDDESVSIPPLPSVPKLKEKVPGKRPLIDKYQPAATVEAIIEVGTDDNVQPAEAVPVAETATATPETPATEQSEGWDILKCIVYGGLDISIASFGVVSSAAGGDAITRTVVYMGLATLLSGLIGFYHNVLNLFNDHRDHYTKTVGKTLQLHGTVALISYFFFGFLAPITYGFAFRESDSRDRKFAATCAVALVSVVLLSLGKARVTSKLYIKTVLAYVISGVVASIIGYIAGEYISRLLESWGL